MERSHRVALAVLCIALAGLGLLVQNVGLPVSGGGPAALRVLVVHETADQDVASSSAISAKAVRDYMLGHGTADGKVIMYVDKDTSLGDMGKPWQDMRAQVRVDQLPFLVVLNANGQGYAGPMVTPADKLLAKLQEYGGP